jgi:salicylate hydroxylase
VIASDGIKSTLRKHLYERKGLDLETQQAVYSDWVAWRGMIPAEKYVCLPSPLSISSNSGKEAC